MKSHIGASSQVCKRDLVLQSERALGLNDVVDSDVSILKRQEMSSCGGVWGGDIRKLVSISAKCMIEPSARCMMSRHPQ